MQFVQLFALWDIDETLKIKQVDESSRVLFDVQCSLSLFNVTREKRSLVVLELRFVIQ